MTTMETINAEPPYTPEEMRIFLRAAYAPAFREPMGPPDYDGADAAVIEYRKKQAQDGEKPFPKNKILDARPNHATRREMEADTAYQFTTAFEHMHCPNMAAGWKALDPDDTHTVKMYAGFLRTAIRNGFTYKTRILRPLIDKILGPEK